LIVVFGAPKDTKMKSDLQGERIMLGEHPPQKKENEAAAGM
jgi:hypothetical protein